MTFPFTPTVFAEGGYDPEWFARDFLHSPDGVQEFPDHHCKLTFLISKPYIGRFRNAVDIGCRDGEYTRYLQHHFQHTFCFDPRGRVMFEKNVNLAKVTHFLCALGDRDETITMIGGAHDLTREGKEPMPFPCLPLDRFNLDHVDYMKIDVEGFERKVLIGAERTIAKCRPVIVIEQNDAGLPDEPKHAAKTWLEERGYRHVATCPRGWDFVMTPG